MNEAVIITIAEEYDNLEKARGPDLKPRKKRLSHGKFLSGVIGSRHKAGKFLPPHSKENAPAVKYLSKKQIAKVNEMSAKEIHERGIMGIPQKGGGVKYIGKMD